jgi:hypothetical protein
VTGVRQVYVARCIPGVRRTACGFVWRVCTYKYAGRHVDRELRLLRRTQGTQGTQGSQRLLRYSSGR